MVFTIDPTKGQSFDAELLRQELVVALGVTGWHLNTAGNQVDVVITDPAITIDPTTAVTSHFNNGAARDLAKRRAEVQKQMDVLDPQAQFMPLRELALAQFEALAAAQVPPLTPAQLYAANQGYRKMKDLDNQLVALRAKLAAIV